MIGWIAAAVAASVMMDGSAVDAYAPIEEEMKGASPEEEQEVPEQAAGGIAA